LFLAKSQFMRTLEGRKEKLLSKNDEESSFVAEGGLFASLMILLGVLNTEKALQRWGAAAGLIIFIPYKCKHLTV